MHQVNIKFFTQNLVPKQILVNMNSNQKIETKNN